MTSKNQPPRKSGSIEHFDVVIIGAGVSGMYEWGASTRKNSSSAAAPLVTIEKPANAKAMAITIVMAPRLDKPVAWSCRVRVMDISQSVCLVAMRADATFAPSQKHVAEITICRNWNVSSHRLKEPIFP